ncbi:MAG: phosphatidate cytidylyltransferase [Gammaproteobacteria bacterium]
MLRARLISAAIMVPAVVGGVLYLPDVWFALILGVILTAGAWEWSRLIPLAGSAAQLAYTAAIALLLWLLWITEVERYISMLLWAAFLWWLWVLFWLSRPATIQGATLTATVLKMCAGMLVLLPTWAALVDLRASQYNGPVLVLILLVLVWLADSGAYFAGRQWGRTKLAPAISPGKTREGVYGGLLVSVVFAAIAGGFLSHSLKWTLAFMLVSLTAVMFSVAGDLLESLMKRQCGVKDSGNIIPGHGGILDRIDSLTAASPMYLLGMHWLGL